MRGSQPTSIKGTVLFCAGLAIIVTALLLFAPFIPGGAGVFAFVAIDVVVLYVLLFSPLALGGRIADLTGGRIVSLGIYWYAVGAYTLFSLLVLARVLGSVHPPLRLFVILQLFGLFGVGLASYLGDAVHGQIEDVEAAQAQTMSSVQDLRASSERLALLMAQLDDGAAHQQVSELAAATARIADDLRYLSPVATPEASRLERRIQFDLNTIMANIDFEDPASIDLRSTGDVMREVRSLLDQRKALRN